MPRWFYTLNGGENPLSKHHSLSCSQGEVIVLRERCNLYTSQYGQMAPASKINMLFALFKSPIEFIDAMGLTDWSTPGPSTYYLEKYPERYRPFNQSSFCCHEVIPGDQPRKLFFDIDGGPPEVVLEVIEVTRKFFSERYQIKLAYEDILITDSSGPDKNSYHLIINNYRIHNATENKYVAMRICNRLSPAARDCIDTQVWSSTHNMRILGYFKLNTTRCKRLIREWSNIHGQLVRSRIDTENELFSIYQATLITAVHNCQILPAQDPRWGYDLKYAEGVEIGNGQAIELLQLVPDNDAFEIDYNNIKPGYVPLIRRKRSLCPICNRHHDSNGSYITINTDNHAYWRCFADQSKTKFLLDYQPQIDEFDVPKVTNLKTRDIDFGKAVEVEILGRKIPIYNPKDTQSGGLRPEKIDVKPGHIINHSGQSTRCPIGMRKQIRSDQNEIVNLEKLNRQSKDPNPSKSSMPKIDRHDDEFQPGYVGCKEESLQFKI